MNIFIIIGYIIIIFLVCISSNGIHGFSMFFDSPTLLFTAAFALITLLGTGTLKEFIDGFKIVFRMKKSYSMLELKKAEQAIHLLIKSLLLFGGTSAVIGFIAMLYSMSTPASIGPALACGLYSVLYALIGSLILTPFKAKIHILLISYAEENETKNTELNEEALEQRIFYLFRSKGLTDRESEIARLVSQEMTNREIAGRLYISEATVKKHITHILEKLKLDGRESIITFISKEN